MVEESKNFDKKEDKEMDREFASFKTTVKDKDAADALQKEFDSNKGKVNMQIEEVTEIKNQDEATVEEVDDDVKDLAEDDDEEAPDLEEVNLEELEKSKEEQRIRFLANLVTEQEEAKKI